MNKELTGKKALVTGGSRGIGAAIATRLASAGADVAITYVGNLASAESVGRRSLLRSVEVKLFKRTRPTSWLFELR